ncbi:MAG: TIGR04283 family arsenosugar biosynthesis glycosyltransferase [Pseudomonadota bacterium]
MSVSIVIPALNEESSLRSLLPGLASDNHVVEVIVADGGSSDATPAIVTEFGAKLVQANQGRARQMNAGAAAATGNILFFLHADTELPTYAFQLIEDAIANGALWGRFDLRLSSSHWLLRIVERMINWRSYLNGIATGDQGIFLRRDLFESLGGYADIPLMEDVELSKRLKRQARPCCIHQPLITSSRRWEQFGILRTIVLMWQMRLAYFLGVSPESLARRYRRSGTAGQGR